MKHLKLTLTAGLGLALLSQPGGAGADTLLAPVAADTFITSGAPDNNAGATGWIDAGTDGVGGVRRGLLRFDLSGLPSGAVVTSAVARLTLTRVPGAGAVDSLFSLYRLTAAWGEGAGVGASGGPALAGDATWNARQSGAAAWTVAGAMSDAEASASASTTVGSAGGTVYAWSGPGLVSDAQAWVSGAAPNQGWLLVSAAEATARSVRGFGAREAGLGAGTLEVGYSMPAANTPPTVALTAPASGASYSTPAMVTLTAAAADAEGTVGRVDFYDGAVLLGAAAVAPFSLAAPFYPGPHVLTAVAVDNLGALATSAPVSITVTSTVIANPVPGPVVKSGLGVELQTVADGMASPLSMACPDDGSGRMFVYDQAGLVWVVAPAGALPAPLLDVRSRLVLAANYDERGLLGFATHPDFANHPLVYTFTSESNAAAADFPAQMPVGKIPDHQSVISEWRIDAANTNRVDPASRREVLRLDKPQSNHNGGTMRFGPDGLLYVTLGDGGQANDAGDGHSPGGNAQNLMCILGKMIRIDVDGRNSANGQYGLPAGNPFDGVSGLKEIYAFGLRNPFSFGFDRQTGQILLADVGQNKVEEVDIIVKGGNYGWNLKEGTFWFDPASGNVVTAPTRQPPAGLIDPIAQYGHGDGAAAIGGFVYRGSRIPALQGRYVFADWGAFSTPAGRLFYLEGANAVQELKIGLGDRKLGFWVKGFGEGPDGELYVFAAKVVGPAGNTGRMMRIVPMPDPVVLAAPQRDGPSNVVVRWSGGLGPYAVQKSAALGSGVWSGVDVTPGVSLTNTLDGGAGFLRVVDTAREPAIPLTVWLSGAAERPATNSSTGSGFGLLSLDGNTLSFSVRYSGLSGTATASHIHGPAVASVAGSVMIDLAPYNGGAYGASGGLSGQILLSDVQKARVLAGRTYINLHTAASPGGEIRGQIVPALLRSTLSTAAERPTPGTGGASGTGVFLLASNQLTFRVAYRGLSSAATAAHIHSPATASGTAGVAIDLAPYNGGAFGTAGVLSGTVALSAGDVANLADGLSYVNFHTPAHPSGELRGQVLPEPAGVPLSAPLSGAAERPAAVTTSAGGGVLFSLEGGTLVFSLSYSNLSGAPVSVRLHGAATSAQTAGAIVDLAPWAVTPLGTAGVLAGAVPLSAAQRELVLGGQVYVNIATAANPNGEIRGQAAPVLMRAYASAASERPTAVKSPASALESMALVYDRLWLSASYGGLLGSATASHIHGPASASQAAGVMTDLGALNGGAWGLSGGLAGSVVLTPVQLPTVVDGLGYVNIHTTVYGGGEIRGQITR